MYGRNLWRVKLFWGITRSHKKCSQLSISHPMEIDICLKIDNLNSHPQIKSFKSYLFMILNYGLYKNAMSKTIYCQIHFLSTLRTFLQDNTKWARIGKVLAIKPISTTSLINFWIGDLKMWDYSWLYRCCMFVDSSSVDFNFVLLHMTHLLWSLKLLALK